MKLTPEYIARQVLTCAFDYDGTLTTCTITTHHGSKHVGNSGSSLDPAEYDREKGEQIAHNKALNQLWALEGYLVNKLGLCHVPGDLLEIHAPEQHNAKRGRVHEGSVTVKYSTVERAANKAPVSQSANSILEEVYASGGVVKAPAVNVVNTNYSALGLGTGNWNTVSPEFQKAAIKAIVAANKNKLGLK